MAVLEATLTGEFAGQLTINRWHYISTGDPGPVTPSYALLMAMGFAPPVATPWKFDPDSLAGYIQHLVSTAFYFRAFYVRNLYTPTDFVETAFNPLTAGDMSGEPSSPVLAYGVQSNRSRTDIRRGSKRFCGVSESGIGSGGIVTDPALGYLAAVADLMSDVLSFTSGGASLTLTPAILQFQEYTTPSGKKAYKKQDSEALQVAHSATGILYTMQPYARSQVSRQRGRGV